jgi:hypothetical protein
MFLRVLVPMLDEGQGISYSGGATENAVQGAFLALRIQSRMSFFSSAVSF